MFLLHVHVHVFTTCICSRSFIWRSLLQLPDNHSAYSVLLAKGTHPAFANLHDNYPIKSPKLLRILQRYCTCTCVYHMYVCRQFYFSLSLSLSLSLSRVLSAIAHWCSLFAEVDYLPAFVFPFVKYFQNNQLVAFEMVTTILCKKNGNNYNHYTSYRSLFLPFFSPLSTFLCSLHFFPVNWCDQWFNYFPNPPFNILTMVENILSYHDPHLLHHLVQHQITVRVSCIHAITCKICV